MSIRRHIGIAAALVSSVVAGSTLTVVAAHADVTTLYVNNGPSAHCSDAGTGTQAQPYCTVQAAADAAQPGQTVQIAEGTGSYAEQVTVTHSGTPGHPITFQGVLDGDKLPTAQIGTFGPSTAGHGFSLSKVHDVTIRNLVFATRQEAVLVADSDRIVIDGNVLIGAGQPSAPGIRLTGATTASTVSRNRIGGSGTAGIVVDPNVSGAVVTTNALMANIGGGIVVTDAPGTVVTSNSVAENCGTGISLAGASSGAVIENNIVTATNPTTLKCPQGSGTELAVSAGSVTGTKADYNVVHPGTGSTGYSWNGTAYASPAAFTTATTQGAHDLDADPRFKLTGSANDDLTPAESAVVDSADSNAPGELTTDLLNNPRVDDPLRDNTGTGTATYYDRGAIEYQNPFAVAVRLGWETPVPAGHPLDRTIVGTISSPWSPATATLDLGDGSGPQPFTGGSVNHTYPGPGTYHAVLTATDGLGQTRTASTDINVAPVGPLSSPTISVVQNSANGPTQVQVYAGVTSPWPLASTTVDFGDGTSSVTTGANAGWGIPHTYPGVGTYTVTATFVDDHGRSLTYSQQARIAGWIRSGTPVTGRWGGSASTHVGVFYNGTWSLATTNDNSSPVVTANFGQAGDVPVAGSWDGGHDQLGIYRNGVFALRHDDASVTVVSFGSPGDIPVPARWDGNGHAQLAIYRPSTNTFAVRHDDGSVTTATLGDPGDLPVVGDWDGVGHVQLGIFRGPQQPGGTNTFALRHDDGSISTATYGSPGDLPVVGDWLGRGRTTFGIYHPAGATFALSNAYAGAADSVFTITTA